MNNLNNYAELEERRRFLTNAAQNLKSEIADLKKKKKYKDVAEKEKELEKSLKELKDVMVELAYVKSKEVKKLNTPPKDICEQLDNEVICSMNAYAVVMRSDGTLAYFVQPDNMAEVGDLALESDLEDFEKLPEYLQEEFMRIYRESRERNFGI